ncbi:MAG: copper resistance protein NlpE N-terminal domain-containing protein [Alistipes communis]
MKSLIPVTAALLLLAACGQRNASRQTAPAAAQTAAPDMHDAENALDYQGTYTGVFPAADVPGIAVTLTLGSDGRYTEVNRYCERPGQFTDSGRYTVRGNILTLAPRFAERHPRLLPGGRKPALAARQPPTAHHGTVRRPVHPHQIGFGNSRRLLLTPLPTRSIPPVRESPPSAHGRSRHRGRHPDRGNQKTSRTGFVREVDRNGTEAPFRRMRCYYLLL